MTPLPHKPFDVSSGVTPRNSTMFSKECVE
jgi:hypothetical protein